MVLCPADERRLLDLEVRLGLKHDMEEVKRAVEELRDEVRGGGRW